MGKLFPSLNSQHFLLLKPHLTFRQRDLMVAVKLIVLVHEFQQKILGSLRRKQKKNMYGNRALCRSHDKTSGLMLNRPWPKLKSCNGINHQKLRIWINYFHHSLNELSRTLMLKNCYHGKRRSPWIRPHLQAQIKILQLLLDWCCHEKHRCWCHELTSRELFHLK